jgi:hypothetical protein
MVRYAVIHSRSVENAGVVGSAGNVVVDALTVLDEDMMSITRQTTVVNKAPERKRSPRGK